ncbi:MAG: hypothetical protein H7249_20315 [Chitinophagaceae bacterium]|nr:hypothetical protein [Oligoflexus sp.]
MRLIFITTLIVAGLSAGCEKYQSGFKLSRSGDVSAATAGQPSHVANVPVTSASAVEIQLLSSKLVGSESKYKSVAKFGGVASAKSILSALSSGVSFKVDTLPTGAKPDVLTIEIYDGDQLKFIAKQANTKLSKAGSVVINDCAILQVPWDGAASDGSCHWTIEEAK